MSEGCKYLVNGDWITEEQFKKVLNNGLLDSLIESKTIALTGFPVNRDLIIKSEKSKTVSNRSVNVEMLQQILIQEVKTRTGYPINMESALELNDSKTDFKIPLWASPYASKFESILTSIVSNKVVKQKFPGHSYVLGSEEGFRIKAGSKKELSKSGIVFSASFDPEKGLQPMRHDPITKKMLPAQIMIPFKFRDEAGNILDITKFQDEEGLLDFSKIPQEVLTLFGFRIPTQEQNSMSSVEIVGFLPEASGDLMLAPRDFTRQMGSDFDVDKMYTYMYNTYFQDGKLHTNFPSNKEKIEAERETLLEELALVKTELDISKEEDAFLSRFLYGEEVDEETNPLIRIFAQVGKTSTAEVKQDFFRIIDRLSVLKRAYVASQQNAILKVHQRVLQSNNAEVIKSIFSLDSSGEFKKLANDISKIRKEKGLLTDTTSILSDEYQKMKYINATAGKAGVGNFSLDSTFNAIAQNKDLFIDTRTKEEIEDGVPLSLVNNKELIRFGDIISFGDLSNKYTLDSQKIIKDAGGLSKLSKEQKKNLKLKSVVIRSLQSGSVDNEKEQILDKLNINNETFDTIRAMALLGFDETDIAGLLTQDIIWEYVSQIQAKRSSLEDYNPNVEEDVVTNLKLKYQSNAESPSIEDAKRLSSISGQQLLENIESGEFAVNSEFNKQQVLLLEKFRYLTTIGQNIKKVQSAINTESKGVPKSLIETQIKLRQINNLSNSKIVNAESLLGEYDKEGLVAPTTVSGFASFYGTKTANQLYKKYFPYQKEGFERLVGEIVFHAFGEDEANISSTQQAKTKQEVFNEVRSFLFSSDNLGLSLEATAGERDRLFIDRTGNNPNISLAGILDTLKTQPWFMENNFLNKLTPTPNKDGSLSRIYFEASTGENFDEKNIYLGFAYLFEKNVFIGKFNGIDYTTRILAQDLVLAAYLEGGNQGAKQYLKYIPTAYMKAIPFGKVLNSVKFDFANTFGGVAADSPGSPGSDKTRPSQMARQYFQNNPAKAKTITVKEIVGGKLTPTIELTEDARKANYIANNGINMQRRFLSIYSKKEPGDYAVYEFNEVTRNYDRISTLSDKYGFRQYDVTNTNPTSVVKKEKIAATKKEQLPPNFQEPAVEPKMMQPVESPRKDLSGEEQLNDILNKLELNSKVSSYNKELVSIIRDLPGLENIKLVLSSDPKGDFGAYNSTSHTLMLNFPKMIKEGLTPNNSASIVIHELIHAFSSKTIKTYNSSKRDSLSAEQISTLGKLENLQKQYLESLVKEGNTQKLLEFHKIYWEGKLNKKQITQEVFDYKMKNGPLGLGNNITEIPSGFTSEDLSKYYGAIKLEEFVTMALTDEGFQQHLNNIKNKEGKTLLDKLFDMLVDLLSSSLGITVDRDSLLAPAIKESLQLIQSNIGKESSSVVVVESKPTTQPSTSVKPLIEPLQDYQYFGRMYKVQTEDGKGIAVNLKQSDSETNVKFAEREKKLLDAFNNNPNVDPQSGKVFKEIETPVTKVETPSGEFKFTYKGKTIDTDFELTQGQREALEQLIDFSNSEDTFITLQGAAGTGKTAVIGYLQKYLKNYKFNYLAPTHAAVAELAFATVKTGNKTLPMTVQSSVYEGLNKLTNQKEWMLTKKLSSKLDYTDNILVVDEVSMLSAREYEGLKEAIKNKNVQVIFMGDILQIPEVDVRNPEKKQVSKAFTENPQINLTEVKRTESDSILTMLTAVRTNINSQIPIVEGNEELKFLNGREYDREIVETFRAHPENTVVIGYTNNSVKDTNKKIRRVLGRDGNLQKGDIITGYLGYGSKQIEHQDIANSVRYTVEKVEKKDSEYHIQASSQKLKQLEEKGMGGVSEFASGSYLALSEDEAFNFEELTEKDFEINNQKISEIMQKLYDIKQKALKNPSFWNDYYSEMGKVSKFFQYYLVGDNYIFNPITNKMEKYNSTIHSGIKKSHPELYIEKAIDFGHAITIHKSQGTTVENVFFDASTLPKGSSSALYQGEKLIGAEKHSLLYVGLSRASKKLVINTENTEHFYPLNGPIPTTKASPSIDEEAFNISDLEDEFMSVEELEKFKLLCKK